MFGTTYSHDVLRKYVILFGTLFNDIYINRKNSAGAPVQTIRVPLSYGPKEKYLARLDGNPDLANKVAITVPRISFEMVSFEYDPDRKLNTLNRKTKNNRYMYQPVPYNIQFEMSVLVKNADDGTKIIEQILPYFTPEWTASIHLVPEMEDDPWDIPIILNDVSVQDSYEGNFETRRAIIWTLSFTMKGYIFGPSKRIGSGDGTDGGIIKYVDVNLHATKNVATANTTNTIATEMVNVYPGLTANGTPTSNSAESISWTLIKSTDNYGFIHEFESNV